MRNKKPSSKSKRPSPGPGKTSRRKPPARAKQKHAARIASISTRRRSATAPAAGAGLDALAELTFCRGLGRMADDTLEECSRHRLSLRATLEQFLPPICEKLGATGALVQTRNEQLLEQGFEHGTWSEQERAAIGKAAIQGAVAIESGGGPAGGAGELPREARRADQSAGEFPREARRADQSAGEFPREARRADQSLGKGERAGKPGRPDVRTLVAQVLDVAGEKVGVAAFSFPGDRMPEASVLAGRVDVVCEELDGVLALIHRAATKQDVILRAGQALRNVVFERGLDDALVILRNAIPLDEVALLYRDESASLPGTGVRYRIYRDGCCTEDSETHPLPRLAELIEREGPELLQSGQETAPAALGMEEATETILISGIRQSRVLGRILVASKSGLSTFGLDLLHVFAELVSQRLVDYNRERRHLSQFFSPSVINELLKDPAYEERYLAPRTDEVAILYADINAFTKISEQILLDPAKIGRFVDRWSAGAVEILWKNGGVFDKMVGDCVIGIFGPPFFRLDRQGRIAAALKAAREIMAFTISLQDDPDMSPIVTSGIVRGMGVAVGLNLCPASIGLFGPNQDFTAFSSGMNATARLQSLAGFREVLIMDLACEVLGPDGVREVTFDGPIESPVKNVAKPLRYYRAIFPELLKR